MASKLIYLLGAGRSGTTLLATVLNAQKGITTLGEMHQLYDHVAKNKTCACGEVLSECSFWSGIIETTGRSGKLQEKRAEAKQMEKHSRIPLYLFGMNKSGSYISAQEEILERIQKNNPDEWLLDSSKYIGRYLLLRDSKRIKIKGIYVVRDVRGVIYSFKKNVQTSRSPISSLIYHSMINFFGQLVCSMDPKIIKVRYEDLASDPKRTLDNILKHINEDRSEASVLLDSYFMPHLIGGNRMKQQDTITIRQDNAWKNHQNRVLQILYYILTMPFMILNRYVP